MEASLKAIGTSVPGNSTTCGAVEQTGTAGVRGKRAFEQYDVVDANRLAAAELEIGGTKTGRDRDSKQQLACVVDKHCSLSPEEETSSFYGRELRRSVA